jgi:hypothetical protein
MAVTLTARIDLYAGSYQYFDLYKSALFNARPLWLSKIWQGFIMESSGTNKDVRWCASLISHEKISIQYLRSLAVQEGRGEHSAATGTRTGKSQP